MPHIFPRRFLRTRDVLDPSDFNEDLHPAYDLISGRLDRMNFDAESLRENLWRHPDSAYVTDSGSSGAVVSAGAYFKTHLSQIESQYEFFTRSDVDGDSRGECVPLNFVQPDGTTFRRRGGYTGVNPLSYPSIVPNSGEWTAVRNEDLTSSQKLTFKSGKAKLWISAYAQYIWQGFYEYKPPWISGTRKYLGAADFEYPPTNKSWRNHFGNAGGSGFGNSAILPAAEADVLNAAGPSMEWEYLVNDYQTNKLINVVQSEYPYSFPLNETWRLKEERKHADKQGYHHISLGNRPCRLQFALRIDGKIIEETITGKRIPTEESSHGLQVTDSIRRKESDEFWEALKIIGYDDAAIERELSESDPVYGQRSFGSKTSIGDMADSRPGQKLKSANAVSYGPEVMPVRLGAVVDLDPGEHTVELVVRRLSPKGKFQTGDFVGVFSRRLLAFELPLKPIRQEIDEGDLSSIPSFVTEDRLTDEKISRVRGTIRDEVNNIKSHQIDDNVLPHTCLPSKVLYNLTQTISPKNVTIPYTGEFTNVDQRSGVANAAWPGFRTPSTTTAKIDNVFTRSSFGMTGDDDDFALTLGAKGWTHIGADGTSQKNPWSTKTTGWEILRGKTSADATVDYLKLAPSSSEQVLRPNESLILMMDVELKGIEPVYSYAADYALTGMERRSGSIPMAEEIRDNWGNYGNYCLAERYLDLFALFAIGYKKNGTWVVGSETTPSIVNSFNWVNRGPLFSASNDVSLPTDVKNFKFGDFWQRGGAAGVGEGSQGGTGWYNPGKGEFIHDEAMLFNEPRESVTDVISGALAPRVNQRGGRLNRSNLGVNVPIMQVITNSTDADITISEIAGFTCSAIPLRWRTGSSPFNPRDMESWGSDESWDEGTAPPPPAKSMYHDWLSPVGHAGSSGDDGRDILRAAYVHYGNCRLTAIKIVE
jgi:hypothetical protein